MLPFQLFQPCYMLEVACQKELAVTFLRRTPTTSFQRGFLWQLEKLSISAVSPASGSQQREVFRQCHFLGALILLVHEFCSISAQIQAGDHLNFPYFFYFFFPLSTIEVLALDQTVTSAGGQKPASVVLLEPWRPWLTGFVTGGGGRMLGCLPVLLGSAHRCSNNGGCCSAMALEGYTV